jgi:tRNA nucleotidyltransferase (CCA-adding enzyme)
MPINTDITSNLTPQEQEIFSVIRKVIEEKSPSTTARVAGGWVRDKLLGVPSDDIDIMVDNMSGEDFARLVTQYIGSKDPNVIRQNPEKSKHIETAKAYIPLSNGDTQEVDFARARQEVYKEDSRIPDTRPATAQEDAHRRDLTINSLFYNINTGQVEDFTGKGIKDLITNTIRTPEDPIKTFSDDPLRIFRVIRFAAKYNGHIDDVTYQAMMDPSLRDEIKKKISKERMGTEMTKMFKNPNPERAIEILKETGLWQDIVSEALKGTKYEGKMAPLDMEQNNPWHKLTLWGHTMQVVKNALERYPEAEPEKRATIILSALMHDLGKLFYEIQAESRTHPGRTSYHGHEKESREIAEHILRYLKMEPFIDQVAGMSRYHMYPHRFTDEGASPKLLRKFIRKMSEQSLNWLDVFNLSVADALAKDVELDPAILQKYEALEAQLQEALASMEAITQEEKITPILNGYEIMQALNIKPGPYMSEMTEFVRELRDEDPDISKEEAIARLQEQYKDFDPQQWQQQKTASAKEDEETGCLCPMTVFKQRQKEIESLRREKKYYEVFSIVKDLLKQYGNAENVIRLAAINMLYLLIKDPKFRDNDILLHLFEKAEHNFFDPVICSFVVAILILEDTATEPDVILEIGNRMVKMAPGILRSALDMLPEDKKLFNPDIKKQLMADLDRK